MHLEKKEKVPITVTLFFAPLWAESRFSLHNQLKARIAFWTAF